MNAVRDYLNNKGILTRNGKKHTRTSVKTILRNPVYCIADKDALIADRDKTIADLQAKLDKKPAEDTTAVVDDAKPSGNTDPKNDVEQFVDTYNSARALYNEV